MYIYYSRKDKIFRLQSLLLTSCHDISPLNSVSQHILEFGKPNSCLDPKIRSTEVLPLYSSPPASPCGSTAKGCGAARVKQRSRERSRATSEPRRPRSTWVQWDVGSWDSVLNGHLLSNGHLLLRNRRKRSTYIYIYISYIYVYLEFIPKTS